MAFFGFRGDPNSSPRARRAAALSNVAPQNISSGKITTTGIASATTINLNPLTSERTHITGTTTITTMQLAEGEFRKLIFDDSLTLTYNASLLILPGSANITTNAGDTCEAEGVDGTIVRIISYQRGGQPPPIGATKVANVRLTLESGVPISTTDQTSKTVLYATPYLGSYIPIYNGSSWEDLNFSEISIRLSDSTNTACVTTNGSPTLQVAPGTNARFLCKGMLLSGTGIPVSTFVSSVNSDGSVTMTNNATASGTITASFSCYQGASGDVSHDVFAVLYNGNLELRVVMWSNQTTRVDAISLQNGIYVNTSDTTQSALSSAIIPAKQGLYLGSIFVKGTAADSAVERGVWNYFNRKQRPILAQPSDDTWTYSTAAYDLVVTSPRSIIVTRGLNEDNLFLEVYSSVISSGATARDCRVGIGLDSTTVNSATTYDGQTVTSTIRANLKATYSGYPGIGTRTLNWIHQGGGADTQTWSGDAGGTRQMGMSGFVFC